MITTIYQGMRPLKSVIHDAKVEYFLNLSSIFLVFFVPSRSFLRLRHDL